MKTKSYTTRDRAKAVELYKSGLSLQQTAQIIGCNKTSVQAWIQTTTPEIMRPPGVKPTSDSEKKRMKKMYKAGYTIPSIANFFNRSRWGVRNILKKTGVKIRPWSRGRDHVRDQLFIEISETYDFSPLTAEQVAKNYGLKKRHQAEYRIRAGRRLRKKYGLP